MAWFTLTHPGLVWLGWVENQSEWQRAGATGAGLASFGRRAEVRGQRAESDWGQMAEGGETESRK